MTTLILLYSLGFCLTMALRWEALRKRKARGITTTEQAAEELDESVEQFRWKTGLELSPLLMFCVNALRKYAHMSRGWRLFYDVISVILWPINLSLMIVVIVVEFVHILSQLFVRR